MRSIATAVVAFLVQSAAGALPPPFPRHGVVKLLDNDTVQVWNVAWLKGEPTALHRHPYDLAGVYYEPGDRVITQPDGAKRNVSTKAWDVTAQRAGLTHIEEGTSDAPLRAVFVEMKRAAPSGTDMSPSDAPAFTPAGATQKLDNDRVTMWEFTQAPRPGRHRHTRDAVVVAFLGGTPKATWIPRGTIHDRDADDGRYYVVEVK